MWFWRVWFCEERQDVVFEGPRGRGGRLGGGRRGGGAVVGMGVGRCEVGGVLGVCWGCVGVVFRRGLWSLVDGRKGFGAVSRLLVDPSLADQKVS